MGPVIGCFVFSILVISPCWSAPATHQTFTGIAKLSSGEVFYTESHEVTWTNDQMVILKTTYKDKNGKLIAELSSDFTNSQFLPETQFLDHRDQYEYKLSHDLKSKKIEMSNRDSAKENWKTKTVEADSNTMVFQGLLNFIRQNLKSFADPHSEKVFLAVPSRLDVVELLVSSDSKALKNQIVISVKAKNYLIRLALSETRLVFDTLSGRLVEFEGVSNLLDEKDRSQKVKIIYEYILTNGK